MNMFVRLSFVYIQAPNEYYQRIRTIPEGDPQAKISFHEMLRFDEELEKLFSSD